MPDQQIEQDNKSDNILDYKDEVSQFWINIHKVWRKIIVAPIISQADKTVWQNDDQKYRRARSLLLDADVLLIALTLTNEKNEHGQKKRFSARQLSYLIAEDETSQALDKARKRLNRILNMMDKYGLIQAATADDNRGSTFRYEIIGSKKLDELFEWCLQLEEFPRDAPPCLQQRESSEEEEAVHAVSGTQKNKVAQLDRAGSSQH